MIRKYRKQRIEGKRPKAEGRQKSFSAFCLLLSAFCFLFPAVVQACSVCGSADDPMSKGMNRSIIFLMTMPFAVFGSIGGGLFYTYRRAHNHRHGWRSWRNPISRRISYWMQKEERN